MAITTNNGKLSMLAFGNVVMPNLPMSPGTLGQDDRQQLLWGFPEILWGETVSLEPMCLHFTPVAVRALSVTPAKVRTLTVTPVAIRSITIEPEEC